MAPVFPHLPDFRRNHRQAGRPLTWRMHETITDKKICPGPKVCYLDARSLYPLRFFSRRQPMQKFIFLLMAILLVMTTDAAAKRKLPDEVPPLLRDNVKYVAPHWDSRRGSGPSREHYIEARDAQTDALLWEVKIYTVQFKRRLERDVQYIFIKKMEFQDSQLVIWNGAGDKFVVDLKTRKVKPAHKVYY